MIREGNVAFPICLDKLMNYDKELGFLCDTCDSSIGGEPLSYMESKFEYDNAGWTSVYTSGRYTHICPICQKKQQTM